MKKDKSTLQSHKKSFLEAVKFLKNTKVKQQVGNRYLHKAPWALFIGTPDAGKTSIIANSEIHFNLARKQTSATRHHDVNWWVSQSVIYLDVPNDYIATQPYSLYKQFLKLLKKHSYQRQTNALVVVVSLMEILQSSENKKNQLIKELATTIQLARQQLGKNIPIYLIINKYDLLTGFKEFFQNYTKDERQQPWGISLQANQQNFSHVLEVEFTDLIQRLNQQVIYRLHHEPDITKRAFIKDLPLQFSKTKDPVINFIKQLYKNCHQSLNLQQVCFTSALQSTSTNTSYKSQQYALVATTNTSSKPYFIHELLQEIIPETEHKKRRSLSTSFYLTAYSSLVLIILLAIFAFTYNFSKTNQEYKRVNQSLADYKQVIENQSTAVKHPSTVLNSLEQLQKVSQELKTSTLSLATPGGITNKKLQRQLQHLYQKKINQLLIPNIKNNLELILTKSNSESSTLLYRALTTYMMLAEPQHFNKQYFLDSMQAIWSISLEKKPKLQQLLLKQLTSLLNSNKALPIKPSYVLINKAKNQLEQLTPTELAFTILKANLLNQTQVLTINFKNDSNAEKIFALKNPLLGISSLYTPMIANQLNTLATQAATQVVKGNWVITNNPIISIPTLNKQVQQVYYHNYAAQWEGFLTNIQLKTPQNLLQLQQVLTLLSSTNSPLQQLISLIKNNVPNTALANSQKLTQFINYGQTASESQIENTLAELNNYLAQVTTPQDAFELSKQRFLNNGNDIINQTYTLAASQTGQLRLWFYQLAQQSWMILLHNTEVYLSNVWQQQIWTAYTNQIRDRYPFSTYTNHEVSLDSFINFFAPGGLLDNFFNQYLRVFIDTNRQPWHAKSLNGLSLTINKDVLKSFERTIVLRNIFFPEHDQNLYLSFTIQAKEYSNNLSNVSFQLGSQKANFSPSQATMPQAFTWPDSKNNAILKVIFTNQDGSLSQLTYHGPWGLWRMFATANLHKVQGSNSQIAFIIKGADGFKFQITPQLHTGQPFSLKYFKHFKLSKNLFYQ